MFSLRGDVHKIYLRLKKVSGEEHSLNQMKELKEIDEIQRLYQSIDSSILKKIHYRMIKEKTGSGTIPIFVTAIPWLCFLFAKQLQQFLFAEGGLLWVFFVFIYITILFISVILHFHEKSWAAVHIEIIQDILEKRNE
ncbi:hypothetical protein [Domibacillus aminovorans]|uniref:Uncharacterized protein n=1 Tax=Domibacillus aminovorans TaxID=29332 RepID=A0A177L4W3_9BACI|nr:hypothetical protein [Domibacillus aminovorans]OAH60708.1 hypothetical protein AWH49_02860 [Domibacillus aminovorans]